MPVVRDRVWLTHKRRMPWTLCPQCQAPLEWRRTDADGWIPCDSIPALYLKGGKIQVVRHRDLIPGCRLYEYEKDKGHKPKYAWIPHFYTCPVLKKERQMWAMNNRLKWG